MDHVSLTEVFVVGRLPHVTYNPREDLGLERQLREYLGDRGTILSVSGPTKTGKTTLLRSVARDAVWLSGGVIESTNDLWSQVAEKLGLWTEVGSTVANSEGESRTKEGGLSAGLASGRYGATSTTESGREDALGRTTSPLVAARSALSGSLHIIVIDDFHYVDPAVQLGIVRGLKDLVFDGLGVVFASVPHRAYDAVRVEKEMTGRVTHLNIEPWEEADLVEIARRGFTALNVEDAGGELAQRLARESFASPHLMQDFCRRLCRLNRIEETQVSPTALTPPDDWSAFSVLLPSTPRRLRSTYWLKVHGPERTASDVRSRTVVKLTSTAQCWRPSLTQARRSPSGMSNCGPQYVPS
ncbi:hypothetical protein [Cellulomonas sp. ATA003]|uniref:hypothetical protein n=1 Tax=Cellulomonas sp. ATA003 TaxID=3073064 RepID=UPI002873518D|nr:hypothetical protein [Cellulomonas sp. ATA003]WNB86690.1 hypothetical protein REH70_05550 [Cellulomonas sp. ATA003]